MKKIYIIHGWAYTLNAWDNCLAELRTAGFEPMMLPVPGLAEPSEKVWDLSSYVSWLSGKLAEEISKGEKVTLLGHSNGGRIAIAYAAANPDKVSKLILEDAAGIPHNEWPLRAKRAVFGSMAKAGRTIADEDSSFGRGLRKAFYKLIGARDYGRAPKNMRETMKNLISIDLTPELSKIKTPTLLIWGEHDTATPVSDAHQMNNLIQGSKLVVVSGAKHSPHQTDPQQVAKEVAQFLQ